MTFKAMLQALREGGGAKIYQCYNQF